MARPTLYRRRTPETTVLYQVVTDHLETLLDDARLRSAHGFGLPRHVEAEFRRYLACGQLAAGFVRVRCGGCVLDRLVAFSCKGCAVCPSCRGRRMADVGAHLVDDVLPPARYRQWTLSLPFRLRLALAKDRVLVARVLGIFVRSIFVWQRAAARAAGLPAPRPGAATAIQRFGSALNLNVHFHAVLPDGVFVEAGPDAVRLAALPRPTDADVAWICDRVARRVLALEARGREEAAHVDEDAAVDGDVAVLAEAAAPARRHAGPRPPPPQRHLTATLDGFSLHADCEVDADDRAALERLVRYGARPPFAHRRLRLTAAGNVAYRLSRPWPSGQTEVVLAPVAFLRRLAALIPPPRQHLLRYHGVFAGHARHRAAVAALVPTVPAAAAHHHRGAEAPTAATRRPRSRLPWAELFRRVFREDLTVCPRCDGTVVVLAAITEPAIARRVLGHLGLPAADVRTAPARAPPEHDGWLDAASHDADL